MTATSMPPSGGSVFVPKIAPNCWLENGYGPPSTPLPPQSGGEPKRQRIGLCRSGSAAQCVAAQRSAHAVAALALAALTPAA